MAAPVSRPKALFLDRDGTLIVDKVYLSDPAGVELFPGVREALHRVRSSGCRLFLFTNQSGIGRGYYRMDDALRVNARFEELVGFPGVLFESVCIAPEAPDQPIEYRKPSPRYILETMTSTGLRANECVMVGDSAADIGAALAAGIRAVAVRTGKVDPASLPVVVENQISVYANFAEYVAREWS